MENQIEYVFAKETQAYKFLNTVKHFDAHALKVKFGRTDSHVFVSYRVATGEFDEMLSELDDLARDLGGEEV